MSKVCLLYRTAKRRSEQLDGRAHFRRLCARRESNRNRHQPAVERDVKEFLPITPPPHLSAAIGRDQPLAPRTWKRLHINFVAPRLVRLKRHPLSVGRHLRAVFIETRLGNRERFSISVQWHGKQVR